MQHEDVFSPNFRYEAQKKVLESLYEKTRLNYQKAAKKLLNKQEAIAKKEIRFVCFHGKEFDLRSEQDFVTEIVTLDPSLHEEMEQLIAISKGMTSKETLLVKNYLQVILTNCKTPGDLFELLPVCLHELFPSLRQLVDTYPTTTTKALFIESHPEIKEGEKLVKQRVVMNSILS